MSLRNDLLEEVYLVCVPATSGNNFLVELSKWRAKINTLVKKERHEVSSLCPLSSSSIPTLCAINLVRIRNFVGAKVERVRRKIDSRNRKKK